MQCSDKSKINESNEQIVRLPAWLKRKSGNSFEAHDIKTLLRKTKLNTVCEEARCPNISECFSNGTATFMILGDICTRGCRFCSIKTGKPLMPESDFKSEAERVVEAISDLKLKYAVITSVARDDLEDGGASGFVETINAIKNSLPKVQIEILIPDLRGNWSALSKIADAGPDVLNHNIETVPRLYRRVRPGATLERSLELLKVTKELNPKIKTKTGIMLGLGETQDEIKEVMHKSSDQNVDIFTAGQYMRPTRDHLPVERYLDPSEFDDLSQYAMDNGLFREIYMGPLVRSSYHAGEVASKL